MRVNSKELPTKFWLNVVGDKVEIYLHENITEVEKDGEVSFDYDEVSGVALNKRDALIAGFIHLKYSVDNELALTHKGIADANDPEYLEYRAFVAEVKLFIE